MAIYLAATDALADVDPTIQRSSSAATVSETYGAMPRAGRDQVDHLLDALDHGKPGSFAARTRAQRTAFLRRAVNGFDGRAEDAHPCATIRCALDFVAATASPSRSASSVGPVGYLAGAR